MPSQKHVKAAPRLIPAYKTPCGEMYACGIEKFLKSRNGVSLCGRVQLLFTSPPFPLNKKKAYGNLQGDDYVAWLADFAPHFKKLLARNGSIVIERGNCWEPGKPIMSTL